MNKKIMSVGKKLMSVGTKYKVLIALDIGNGYLKCVVSINNITKVFVMPSGFLYESDVETVDLGLGGKNNNRYFIENENNPNPTVLIWDEEVSKSIYFNSLIGGKDRYKTSVFSTFISMAIHKALELVNVENKNEVELYVISGVPNEHTDTIVEDELKEAFFNAPKINAKGEVFQPKVKEVKIMAQPVGTVLNNLLDENGLSRDEVKVKEHNIAVFDIGTKTTDGSVVKNTVSIPRESFTVNTGMFNVYNDVVEHIRKKTGSSEPFANIENQFNKEDYKISERKRIPIKKTKEKSINEKFDILLNAFDKWDNKDRFDEIIISGGGATIFYPLFKEKGYDVTLAEDNQMANVFGYYKIGLVVYDKFFEEVKK